MAQSIVHPHAATVADLREAAQAVITAHRTRYPLDHGPQEHLVMMRSLDIVISTEWISWEITVWRGDAVVCAITASGASVTQAAHLASAVQCLRDIAARRIVMEGEVAA